MKRIFLASSISKTAKPIASEIKKEYGKDKNRLLFITTASEPKEGELKWQIADRKELGDAGFVISDFTITGKTENAIRLAVENTDIIHFNGGNVFYLLSQLQMTKSIEVFKTAVEEGKIYIGSSAGSIIASPDIWSARNLDNLEVSDQLKDYRGLSLVDFLIFPHWGSEHFKERYLDQKLEMAYPGDNKIILLRDNQYVSVKDDDYRITGI